MLLYCVSAVKKVLFPNEKIESSLSALPPNPRRQTSHCKLQIVVADPLEGFVVDRILAVLEAHRRVELLELSSDERGTVVGGGRGGGAAAVVGLIRCTVAVTLQQKKVI